MNPNSLTQRLLTMTAIASVVGTMTLAGCSPRDNATNTAVTPASTPVTPDNTAVVQTETKTETKTEAKTDEMKSDAAKGMETAKDATRDAMQEVKQATENAGEKIADKAADAMITTSVNAELAKDSSLSALKINVDTDAGRVALKGTAPTEMAREHATTLASGVKGVVSVDNQLTVAPK